MSEQQKQIEIQLERRPDIVPIIVRICEELNRLGGKPPKRMSLGRHLDRLREIEPLRELFGETAVTESRDGFVSLHFERTPYHIPPDADLESISIHVYGFFADLRGAVGIPFLDKPGRMKSIERETDTILAHLRWNFPTLEFAHEELSRRRTYWVKRVISSEEPIQELLNRALHVVEHVKDNLEPVTFAQIGAELFYDSKALRGGEARRLAGDFLAILDNPGQTPDADARAEAWRRRNVVINPSAIKVTLFGPLLYWKKGQLFDWIFRLWECGESATLSLDNLAGIDCFGLPPDFSPEEVPLLSCENETPFYKLVRERMPGMIVYTEGYPNEAVKNSLRLLCQIGAPVFHWGDSDLDGLRIAAMLYGKHPVSLFRCGLSELERNHTRLRPLESEAHSAAVKYLRKHDDFPFAAELSFTIKHGWLEQEAWIPPGFQAPMDENPDNFDDMA